MWCYYSISWHGSVLVEEGYRCSLIFHKLHQGQIALSLSAVALKTFFLVCIWITGALDKAELDQDVCSCSRLAVNYVTLAVGEVLLLILTVCSLAATFPRVRKQNWYPWRWWWETEFIEQCLWSALSDVFSPRSLATFSKTDADMNDKKKVHRDTEKYHFFYCVET